MLLGVPEILRQLILLLQDKNAALAKYAALALINIAGEQSGANALLIISESSKSTNDNEVTDNMIYLCFK